MLSQQLGLLELQPVRVPDIYLLSTWCVQAWFCLFQAPLVPSPGPEWLWWMGMAHVDPGAGWHESPWMECGFCR
jgi:hypothetical protein